VTVKLSTRQATTTVVVVLPNTTTIADGLSESVWVSGPGCSMTDSESENASVESAEVTPYATCSSNSTFKLT